MRDDRAAYNSIAGNVPETAEVSAYNVESGRLRASSVIPILAFA